MPFGTWLGLVLCNVLWAANPIMGKILLSRFPSEQVAWLRYASATAFYLLFVAGSLIGGAPLRRFFAAPRSGKDAYFIAGLGISAFCFAPLIGFTGLAKTAAVDNAILIALEPLVTIGLAALFLRERFGLLKWMSLAASILGFSFLSGLVERPASTWMSSPEIVGNLILLVSLIGEGGYSIYARLLQGRYATLPVFGSGLWVGFGVLTAAVLFLGGLPDFSLFGWKEGLALFWLGPLGSTVTYLYWALALEKTDVSSAALTLFVQPVVGAILGVLIFGEVLTPLKILGAALIFCAVGILTVRRSEKRRGVENKKLLL
jgi:drug/metabolite transporter (DMT)-like permease